MPGKSGEIFCSTIVRTLQEDSELVSLTNHDPLQTNGYHIGMVLPNVKGRTPYVGVDYMSFPVSQNLTRLQRALVDFIIDSTDPLTTVQIADRIECILHGDPSIPGQDLNGYFWNPSGPGISFKDFSFVSRSRKKFNDDFDTYNIKIVASTLWIDIDCLDAGNELSCA